MATLVSSPQEGTCFPLPSVWQTSLSTLLPPAYCSVIAPMAKPGAWTLGSENGAGLTLGLQSGDPMIELPRHWRPFGHDRYLFEDVQSWNSNEMQTQTSFVPTPSLCTRGFPRGTIDFFFQPWARHTLRVTCM